MKNKLKRQSDYICSRIIESIGFKPFSVNDSFVAAGHLFGPLGLGYWISEERWRLFNLLPSMRGVCEKDISLNEAHRLVTSFVKSHIHPLIVVQFDWLQSGGSLSDSLPRAQFEELKEQFYLHITEFFKETWFWFPLNSIEGSDFQGKKLLLESKPSSENVSQNRISAFIRKPAFEDATKYAGVQARSLDHANEKIGVLIGALFLCMHSGTHFLHTLGNPSRNVMAFNTCETIYSSRAYLPCLGCPIFLSEADIGMLEAVDSLLQGRVEDRKLIRALRWLSAAWLANGAERFSLICQTIDALTPNSLNTMRAKCCWIFDALDGTIAFDVIEKLFKKIRSDVAHGDAPSLIESKTYLDFLNAYEVDPELASVEIARKVIVDNFLPQVVIRPNPWSLIPELVASQEQMFERFGMEFSLPSKFDFSKLSVGIEP